MPKSLIAKVIGLESNRHFWRGVVDGDGYLEIRNGQNTDRIVVLGSHELVFQFKSFNETNIPDAYTLIKRDENIHRLIVHSNTARNLARVLYHNCSIALQRKLMRAQQMFNHI